VSSINKTYRHGISEIVLKVALNTIKQAIKLSDKICQYLTTGRWFPQGTPVSSTNKTDRHDITEILLEVALKNPTITPEY